MTIQYQGMNATTNRHHIYVGDNEYTFDVDATNSGIKAIRDASGKSIARTYKGFRGKLGIIGGSAAANALTTQLREAYKIARKA